MIRRKWRAFLLPVVAVFVLASLPAPRAKAAEPQGKPSKTIVSSKYDFDGDGKKDALKVDFYVGEARAYVININGAELRMTGETVLPKVHLVDIDKKDKRVEFAISEDEASDDYVTHFFSYDGNSVLALGTTNGRMGGSVKIPGDGNVRAASRSRLLHTWYVSETYRIDPGTGQLAALHQEVYDATSPYPTSVKKAFRAYQNNKDDAASYTLKKGTKIKLTGSDEIHWVRFQDEKGKTGWIRMTDDEEFGSSDIRGYGFAGAYLNDLCFAD